MFGGHYKPFPLKTRDTIVPEPEDLRFSNGNLGSLDKLDFQNAHQRFLSMLSQKHGADAVKRSFASDIPNPKFDPSSSRDNRFDKSGMDSPNFRDNSSDFKDNCPKPG